MSLSKKDLYHLSVKIAGMSLRSYFNSPENSFDQEYFNRTPANKELIKKVYDLLATHCLDDLPTSILGK